MNTNPKSEPNSSPLPRSTTILCSFVIGLSILCFTGSGAIARQDTTGTLVDAGTFTVRIPEIDDWTIDIDKERGIIECNRRKQELLSWFVRAGGSTGMTVFRNRLSGGRPGVWLMTADQAADDFRRQEVQSTAAMTPPGAKLKSSVMDTVTVEGKFCYRLTLKAEADYGEVTTMLHLYFPPEFSRTKEFFGFLISDASIQSMWTADALDKIAPLIRSFEPYGSRSTLPGVGGDLLIAAARGDSTRVKHLVEGGANVNARPADGRGALALAVLHGHGSVVRYLVGKGAAIDPDNTPELYTPLTSAIIGRDTGIAGFLLEMGASPNAAFGSPWSPLLRAITMHLDTAFMGALLARGADPNRQNAAKITALMQAAAEGLAPVVPQLLDHGADLKAQDVDGWTALEYAVVNAHPDIAETLLARGADPNVILKGKHTLLMLAAIGGDTGSAARLIGLGAAVNAVNEDGETPLSLASSRGHPDCVRLLLRHGATVDHRTSDGRTPLFMAVQNRNVDCARVLLEGGADINGCCKGGWSPLMVAALKGDSLAVDLLISRGARLSLENDDGDDAHEIAEDNDFDSIAEMIEKAEERE